MIGVCLLLVLAHILAAAAVRYHRSPGNTGSQSQALALPENEQAPEHNLWLPAGDSLLLKGAHPGWDHGHDFVIAHGEGVAGEAAPKQMLWAAAEYNLLLHSYATLWFFAGFVLAILVAWYFFWQSHVAQWEHARAMQQAFAAELIASQESERKRIAGESHDSLGQHLLIIKNWADLALAGGEGSEAAKESLTAISSTAWLAIDEVRAIAHDLCPSQLERLGLTTAIHDLVDQVQASSNIHFVASIDRLDHEFD